MFKDFIEDLTYLINYYLKDYKKTKIGIKKSTTMFSDILSNYQVMVMSYNDLRKKIKKEGDTEYKLDN